MDRPLTYVEKFIVIGVFLYIAYLAHGVAETLKETSRVEVQAQSQGILTLESRLGNTLEAVPPLVDRQLTGFRGEMNAQVAGIRKDLDQQLTAANANLHIELSTANDNLDARLKDFNANGKQVADAVTKVTDPAASVISQVNASLPMFLECDQNAGGGQDCLFNRYQGTSKAIETSAIVFSREFPKLIAATEAGQKSVDGILENTNKITADFQYGVHRYFHPPWPVRVYNLGVTAAEFFAVKKAQ